MSSFINSATHFNSIENKLKKLLYDNNFYIPYTLRTVFEKWYNKRDYLIEDLENEIENVLNNVKELQVLCVSLQYKHHYKDGLDEEIKNEMIDVKIKTQVKEITLHGLLNALQCTNYQIELNYLEELRPLTIEEKDAMLFLNEMTNFLAFEILRRMADDKSNTWEIKIK